MEKENQNVEISLTKESKDVILCFNKKYERRILAHLYTHEGDCRFGELTEKCLDNPIYNSAITKACNRLKALGLITSDNGKGRNGSRYNIVEERYEFLTNLVTQLNEENQNGRSE